MTNSISFVSVFLIPTAFLHCYGLRLAPIFAGSNVIDAQTTSLQGRMTARIVPSELRHYRLQKPRHKYKQDVNVLLQQLDPVVDENGVAKILPINPEIVLIHAETEKEGEPINFYAERASNESPEKGLKRLCMSIMAEFNKSTYNLPQKGKRNKKSRKSKMPQHFITPSKLPSIRVGHEFINTKELSGLEMWESLSNQKDAFISFPLALGQTLDLQLDACPPTILSVNSFHDFQSRVYCGVPLAIQAKILHGHRVKVSWFVDSKLVESDSDTYTPSEADVGGKVQVVVSTVPSYESEAYEFEYSVEPLPFLPIIESRKHWTDSPSGPNRVRVMTYNLLADQYAKQIPPDHYASDIINRSRRMPLLLYEILAYKADIICLQEVDENIYNALYLPVLESKGYEGFFAVKMGSKEGLAMFWSTKEFECLEEINRVQCPLNEILLQEDCKGWDAHLDLLQQLPRIKRRLKELGQILQCVQLVSKSNPSEKLIIANTHLYYHPLGDHIRALQTYGICRKLVEIQDGDLSTPILLCGDLNSNPDSGASQLLRHGRIDVNADVWENLLSHPKPRISKRKSNREGDASEKNIVPPTLILPLNFPRLRPSGNPTFTHCIPQFTGVLDYILSSSYISCVSTAPMPTTAEYMPNAGVPSDHVSLVSEYDLRSEHIE